MSSSSSHQFAFYFPALSTIKAQHHNYILTLNEADLIHRITHVVRLAIGESFILFNNHEYIVGIYKHSSKKELTVAIEQEGLNKPLAPSIKVLLPVLKKDAFESALYNLTSLGITSITPYLSAKTHQGGASLNSERLNRIMIAAAEQSKQFVFPQITAPQSFTQALDFLQSPLLYADPQGTPLLNVIDTFKKQMPASLTIMVGPEGDLTTQEKEILVRKQALFCRLTSSILKAEDALFLLAGILRLG